MPIKSTGWKAINSRDASRGSTSSACTSNATMEVPLPPPHFSLSIRELPTEEPPPHFAPLTIRDERPSQSKTSTKRRLPAKKPRSPFIPLPPRNSTVAQPVTQQTSNGKSAKGSPLRHAPSTRNFNGGRSSHFESLSTRGLPPNEPPQHYAPLTTRDSMAVRPAQQTIDSQTVQAEELALTLVQPRTTSATMTLQAVAQAAGMIVEQKGKENTTDKESSSMDCDTVNVPADTERRVETKPRKRLPTRRTLKK